MGAESRLQSYRNFYPHLTRREAIWNMYGGGAIDATEATDLLEAEEAASQEEAEETTQTAE